MPGHAAEFLRAYELLATEGKTVAPRRLTFAHP
ncbi:hypothetical protein QF026_001364 [Streptomyces aurantiacus]|nr:hypothetical protein [Streptomyces aurantiacus]